VLEHWEAMAWSLHAIMWPDKRIAEVKELIHEDEVLHHWPRHDSLVLRNARGQIRTLSRWLEGRGT